MVQTKEKCRECGAILYATSYGNYWCKECNERKDDMGLVWHQGRHIEKKSYMMEY